MQALLTRVKRLVRPRSSSANTDKGEEPAVHADKIDNYDTIRRSLTSTPRRLQQATSSAQSPTEVVQVLFSLLLDLDTSMLDSSVHYAMIN